MALLLHEAGDGQPLEQWVASIRSDSFHLMKQFEKDIARYCLAGDAAAMLESTIDLVAANVSMRMLDELSYEDLLRGQHPSSSAEAYPYRIVFDLGAAGAVFRCDAGLKTIDLADLYGFPWDRLMRVGFSGLWVERSDRGDLPESESVRLITLIQADFGFDYSADELNVQFDVESWPGVLHCEVSDETSRDEE